MTEDYINPPDIEDDGSVDWDEVKERKADYNWKQEKDRRLYED